MSPNFYSLGMIITGRAHDEERPTLSAMDLLAAAIADEEHGYHPLIEFLFTGER